MSLYNYNLTKELPKMELFLAKPNKTIIAKLNDAFDISLNSKLSNIGELSFNVPYEIEVNHELVKNPNAELTKDRYLIKLQYNGDYDWYTIRNNKEDVSEDKEVKTVTAYLLPYEMTDKTIHTYEEEAINFRQGLLGAVTTEADGTPRIIEGILTETRWKIGYMDAEFETTYRGFSFTSTTVLDALFQMAETFKAVLVWDTEKRVINFYNSDNYGINRGLTVSYGKYLKSLSRESDADEMVTRYKGFGSDELSIQRVNLTGQNYIEDYTFFLYPFSRDSSHKVLSHSDYMEDDLCHAILDYTEYLKSKEGEFKKLLAQQDTYQTEISTLNNDLFLLNTDLEILVTNLDLANYNGADTTEILAQKSTKETEISAKKAAIANQESLLEAVESGISELRTNFSNSRFFTDAQLEDLNDFVIVKEWSDSNYTDDYQMLEQMEKDFEDLRQPKIVITVSMADFMKSLEGQRDWDKLNLGDIINIRYERLDIIATAKIIEYTISEDQEDINLTIANVTELLTDEEKLIKMLYSSSSAASKLDINASKWDGIDHTASLVDQIINNTWDATKNAISAGNNNDVEISKRGIIVRDLEDPMSWLIIQNGLMAITNDSGNSWKNAITKDGACFETVFFGVFPRVDII